MASRFTDEHFAELEDGAYEAAILPELWPSVLGRLGELTDTAGGAFAAVNERGAHIACAPVLDEVREIILQQGYLTRSGRAAGAVAKGLAGVPRFVNEYDYYDSLEDADSDPIVAEVFRKAGFGWAAGWVLQLPHGDTLIMNVEQYHERGPIVGEALERLDSVYSIFARAAALSARADFARVRTAIDMMTALGLPAAALTPAGKVVLANDAFAAATHVWTTRGGERLALHDREAGGMLTDALETLRLVRTTRSIPVRSIEGGPLTAVLQLVPIRRAAHDIFGSADAIIVLSEPKRDVPGSTLVQSLFDLTPAELSVAQAISAGQSVASLAAETGRSVSTVRNQLRSVMTKAGVKRQVDLVILMRQLKGAASG